MNESPVKIWLGMNLQGWFRLLKMNQFDFDSAHRRDVAVITLASVSHALRRRWQRRFMGGKIERTVLHDAPLFIIGHWRSGTTYLHNLFSQDPRFVYPTTSQCMSPNSFLLVGPVGKFITRRLLSPSKRPMDEMDISFESPQEDEFGLCNLGLPSPYLKVAFPNRPEPYPGSLDLEGLDPRLLDQWKKGFVHFLKTVSYAKPGRILLKSPTRTCRIKTLLELFPKAQFLHIVRSPYSVIPSTINLWHKIYPMQALQQPDFSGLESYVFEQYDHVMKRVEETKSLVPAGQFCEVRYEDVVPDPAGAMARVYAELKLGAFEEVRPNVEKYLATLHGYKKNRWDLSPVLRERIAKQCDRVIRKYGYSNGG